MPNKRKTKKEDIDVTNGNMPIEPPDAQEDKPLSAGAILSMEAQENVREIKADVKDIQKDSRKPEELGNTQLLQDISSRLATVNGTLVQIAQAGMQPSESSKSSERTQGQMTPDMMQALLLENAMVTANMAQQMDAIGEKMGIFADGRKGKKGEGKASLVSGARDKEEKKKRDRENFSKTLCLEFSNVIDQGLDKTLARGFKSIERRMLMQMATAILPLVKVAGGVALALGAVKGISALIEKYGKTITDGFDWVVEKVTSIPIKLERMFNGIFDPKANAEVAVREAKLETSGMQWQEDYRTAQAAGKTDIEAKEFADKNKRDEILRRAIEAKSKGGGVLGGALNSHDEEYTALKREWAKQTLIDGGNKNPDEKLIDELSNSSNHLFEGPKGKQTATSAAEKISMDTSVSRNRMKMQANQKTQKNNEASGAMLQKKLSNSKFEASVNAMLADAKGEGIDAVIVEGDRTYERQKYLWDNKKKGEQVAEPGKSPHEAKNAVDILILKNGEVVKSSDDPLYTRLGELAKKHGLNNPLSNDRGHFQPIDLTKDNTSVLFGKSSQDPQQKDAITSNGTTTAKTEHSANLTKSAVPSLTPASETPKASPSATKTVIPQLKQESGRGADVIPVEDGNGIFEPQPPVSPGGLTAPPVPKAPETPDGESMNDHGTEDNPKVVQHEHGWSSSYEKEGKLYVTTHAQLGGSSSTKTTVYDITTPVERQSVQPTTPKGPGTSTDTELDEHLLNRSNGNSEGFYKNEYERAEGASPATIVNSPTYITNNYIKNYSAELSADC